jgi:hypothetical protein
MSIFIRRSHISQLLFALCIGVPYLNNYELTFAIWSIAAALTVCRSYSLGIIKQIACYVAILAIAIIVFFFKEYELYFVIRDITYLLKPIIGLILGYQLCKDNFPKALTTLLYTALGIAIIHLIVLLNAVIVLHASTVNDLRLYGGYFSDFETYALIILIFHKKFEINFSKKKIFIFTVVIGISAFLYLARTNFMQFVILFVALKGYLKMTPQALKTLTYVIFLGVLGYLTILQINPKRNGQGFESFLYKIKVAPIEPFKTRIKRDDWKDFNDNYRSYENISTVRQVSNDGFPSILFGKGVGSRIDLRQTVRYDSKDIRFISIMHNGFMTVFLKSGLLGVSMLFISIFLLFRRTKSDINIVNQINWFFVGSGIYMLASYWVFMGFYFIADTKSLLFGFLICYREMALNRNSQPKVND